MSAKNICTWISVVLALVAAAMWWRASTVKVDAKKLAEAHISADGWAPAQITLGDADVVATGAVSSRWNAWAAMVTGLSVALQAIANLLPA